METLAESWITPVNPAPSPTICLSQSMTTSSTSVAAGLVCQLMAWAASPLLAMSASTEARSALAGK